MQSSVRDLSWLLTNGYATPSSIKLVGDRYQLTERQRTAVIRCACSDTSLDARNGKLVSLSDAHGADIAIDGFNLLTTIEVALSNGVLIRGRDNCTRDVASMHGTYRRVEETVPAITEVGRMLTRVGAKQVLWLLDRPVSNSGRLKKIIESIAQERGWNWNISLDNNPDNTLISMHDKVIVSADSYVIEHSNRWLNAATAIVDQMPEAEVLDLGCLCRPG